MSAWQGELNVESEDYRYFDLGQRIRPEGGPPREWGCLIHPDEFRNVYMIGNGKLETVSGEQITNFQIKNWIDLIVRAFADYLEHDIYPRLWRHQLPANLEREIEPFAEWENLHPVELRDRKHHVLLSHRPLLRLHKWELMSANDGRAVADLTKSAVPIHSRSFLKSSLGLVPGLQHGAGYGFGRERPGGSGEDNYVYAVDYTSGYDHASRVPRELKQQIVDQLIIEVSSAHGEGIAGGLAGSSISVGPLHESVQLSQSATSGWYGPRLTEKTESRKRWDSKNLLKYRGIKIGRS